ncbi:unnamed protein product [Caenorhabditis angaria]|uniref:Uncharacterized protein n=1 Tax=Caenorhabditis angaria TaxID=860376 RepID=A0A9P1NB33_9PELO|nr:unnamed protein product [Caenorhabditis angaria]
MDRRNVPNFVFDENEQSSSRLGELQKHIVCNHLILQNIVDSIENTATKTYLKLSCKRMNWFCSMPNRSKTTLTIEQSDDNGGKKLEVTHNNIKYMIQIESNNITNEDFDRIMMCLPVLEVDAIHRIAIKGRKYLFRERRQEFDIQLQVSSNVFGFLDRFPGLAELELTDLNLKGSVEGRFISRIRSLKLLDLSIHRTQVWQLVGPNVQELHLTESMLRFERADKFRQLAQRIPNTSIYLDDKEWCRHVSYDVQNAYHENFKVYHWYRMLEREFSLNDQPIKSPKYCYHLRSITLLKAQKVGKNEDILERIGQLELLPKLEKVSIDGYFEKLHFKKLLDVLKKCKNITKLSIKRRHQTTNIRDWANFINDLPDHILCLKLNNCTTENEIYALKMRKARTLRSLEVKIDEDDLSLNSFKKIFQDFPKLHYLKLIYISLNLENIQLLENCRIPKIEMLTKSHEDVSSLQHLMERHFAFVELSNDLKGNIMWLLAEEAPEAPLIIDEFF